MALKVMLRQIINDGKIWALLPEIPGSSVDECLIYDEDGKRFCKDIKKTIKNSKKIDEDLAIWLIEKLEKEFGALKLVKKEHSEDFNKRFKRLGLYRR